jgi:hypothetical protein
MALLQREHFSAYLAVHFERDFIITVFTLHPTNAIKFDMWLIFFLSYNYTEAFRSTILCISSIVVN